MSGCIWWVSRYTVPSWPCAYKFTIYCTDCTDPSLNSYGCVVTANTLTLTGYVLWKKKVSVYNWTDSSDTHRNVEHDHIDDVWARARKNAERSQQVKHLRHIPFSVQLWAIERCQSEITQRMQYMMSDSIRSMRTFSTRPGLPFLKCGLTVRW